MHLANDSWFLQYIIWHFVFTSDVKSFISYGQLWRPRPKRTEQNHFGLYLKKNSDELWINVHHHLFQFKILASKTSTWFKEIICCTVKVSKVTLSTVPFDRDRLPARRQCFSRADFVLRSYDGVSGGHATFSHVPSISPRRLFVHQALRSFWTWGHAHARSKFHLFKSAGKMRLERNISTYCFGNSLFLPTVLKSKLTFRISWR